MYIQLAREYYTNKSTEGKLFVNGEFECYTLEDTDRNLESGGEKIYGNTAIPKGKYEIDITKSFRFKRELPLLLNVPQFEGVRIHIGNTSEDTDGCILVGVQNKNFTDDFIGQSKIAFDSLFGKMKASKARGESITIEIV
jgi:hypothetical protein